MKYMILIAVLGMSSSVAQATVDVQGEATIVVENYHEEGSYFLRTVPTDFCVGIEALTLATAVTQPVVIHANYGCGSTPHKEQINAATCATLTANEVPNADGSYNPWAVSVTKDLSKCGEKAKNENFVRALDNAIYNTYNANGYQVVELK